MQSDNQANKKKKQVIIVLEGACLETVKSKKGYVLLNADDHKGIVKKMGRDASESRPDICHQCLLTLQDSVLNKAGMLRIFIHTSQNVLIEVNPKLRVPRTFKRFGSMIVQLLDKRKIRSHTGEDWLMKVVKNPVTDHLPTGAHIFGTSVTGTLVDPLDFVEVLNENTDANKNVDSFVFVFGAFAHGHLNLDYIETMLSFSQYPLSGSVACGKLMNAFEEVWKLH